MRASEETREPPFVGIHDETSSAILKSSLRVNFMSLMGDGSSTLAFSDNAPARPCHIVADAYVCLGDEQIPLGTTWIEKDIATGSLLVPAAVVDRIDRAPGPIRIRLKPNLDAAWRMIGAKEVWDGDDIYLETQPRCSTSGYTHREREIEKSQQKLKEQPD